MSAPDGSRGKGGPAGGARAAAPSPTRLQTYQVYPFYSATDGADGADVYLLPPGWTTYGGTVQSFAIALLNDGPEQGPLPQPIGNDDFRLELQGPAKPPYTQGNVNAQVTITGKTAWSTAPAARQTLMDNFTSFLLAIEASDALIPSGVQRIAAQVADWMPAPLAETLFWRYSLSSGRYAGTIPYVDVLPGMRLRLDAESSQFVDPGAPQNAYVAGSRLAFPVGSTPGSDGSRTVSFDALLASIKAPTVAPPPGQPQGSGASPAGVASGALDLEPTGGARGYWRLLYPASVPSPYAPGDVSIGDNVVLLGAATLAALDQATAGYPMADTSGDPPNVYLTFLGRALAAPEIPVFVALGNGPRSLEWVPVGTTVANILERFGPLPLSPTQTVLGGLLRLSTASPIGSPTVPVTLTVSDPATGSSLTALPPSMFDLPLIAGDGVTVNI
jgi:hypothetical protein